MTSCEALPQLCIPFLRMLSINCLICDTSLHGSALAAQVALCYLPARVFSLDLRLFVALRDSSPVVAEIRAEK